MKIDDIRDDEFRLITSSREQNSYTRSSQPSGTEPNKNKPRKRLWLLLLALLAVVAAMVLAFLLYPSAPAEEEEVPSAFEQDPILPVRQHPLADWVEQGCATEGRGVIYKDTMVNDIPLQVLLPIGAKPRLSVGYACLSDTAHFVMLCQAADVRADNKKIVGAFVLHGEPKSWSLGKRGYCAIIDDTTHIGVAENTPLFEEAINRNGDFFRQYPLVSEGVLVENELKTKSLRKALCSLEGATVVVRTDTPESLHDFAQALVDIGVQNAIYLVGGSSVTFVRDTAGLGVMSGLWEPRAYPNVSFILWY